MIERPEEYLQRLIDFKDKNLIKVVTGIRRCGKSTLFELYQEYLKKQGILTPPISHNGIKQLNVNDWLLQKEI